MDSKKQEKWCYTIYMAEDAGYVYEVSSECFGFDTKEEAQSYLDRALNDPIYSDKDVYGIVREECIG